MRGNHNFPSQVVSDSEKSSHGYGLEIAQAIEAEWFDGERNGNNRYFSNSNNFRKLRLYARGEQSIQKYKDELSINGDLSYLNLDVPPVLEYLAIFMFNFAFSIVAFGLYKCLLQAIIANPELIDASCLVLLFIPNPAQSLRVLLKYILP